MNQSECDRYATEMAPGWGNRSNRVKIQTNIAIAALEIGISLDTKNTATVESELNYT